MTLEQTLARWQRHAVDDPDLAAELHRLKPEQLHDCFYRELSFGTGGLRGLMGPGPNRMNLYTVRRATQGLARHLRAAKPLRPVAIAYDSRLCSALFAAEAARVLAGNGVFVWLYPRIMPTPALSFAVRHLGCTAGICITASHNPAEYNGYKVYGPDGGQITDAAAAAIGREIGTTDPFDDVKLADFDKALDMGLIRHIREAVVDAFLDAVAAQSVRKAKSPSPLRVVYTPLHGTGTECVVRTLERARVRDMHLVLEQAVPDGHFPTCPSPNPENPDALKLGIETMRRQEADLLLATDPDCDRVGVAVRHGGEVHRLSGNEVGVLLLDYLCAAHRAAGTLPKNPLAITTVVSTGLADPVAKEYGASVCRVLTGFKYIGEQIGLLEKARQAGRFVLGFEESCGYLTGGYVRDKDGVGACLLVCEMARWHREKGRTLMDALNGLFRRHGVWQDTLHSFAFEGGEGQKAMKGIMARLRQGHPAAIAGLDVLARRDYLVPIAASASAGLPVLPPADMLEYRLAGGARTFVRPSGTEPKIKLYIETTAASRMEARRAGALLYDGMRALLLQPPPEAPEASNRATQGEPWQSSNYPPQQKATSGEARA